MEENYKTRLVAEYADIKAKYNSLNQLLARLKVQIEYPNYITEPIELTCPFELLEEQAYYMREYLSTLEKRAVCEGVALVF